VKKEITGYITCAIDNHNRTIEIMKKSGNPSGLMGIYESYTAELSDLLDFIEADASVDRIAENDLLRKRVSELEVSCENMNEVEKNLHSKIKELEMANILYKNGSILDGKRIAKLEKELLENNGCIKTILWRD
jgi:hypothetical protein